MNPPPQKNSKNLSLRTVEDCTLISDRKGTGAVLHNYALLYIGRRNKLQLQARIFYLCVNFHAFIVISKLIDYARQYCAQHTHQTYLLDQKCISMSG